MLCVPSAFTNLNKMLVFQRLILVFGASQKIYILKNSNSKDFNKKLYGEKLNILISYCTIF